MMINSIFGVIGALMLRRRLFLYLAPVLILVIWRFASVTEMRNFTVDELLVILCCVKIAQMGVARQLPNNIPILKWIMWYLVVQVFTALLGLIIFQSLETRVLLDVLLLQIKQQFYLPIIFLAGYVLLRDVDEGKNLLRWLGVLTILFSAYAIIQYHFFILRGEGHYGSFWFYSYFDEESFWEVFSGRRAFGCLGHPAPLGRVSSILVIVGLVQALQRTGAFSRTMGMTMAVLSFYVLGISGSRGPMVGLLVAVAVILYLMRNMLNRNMVFFIILVIALSQAVPEVMSERMGTAIELGAKETNVDARFDNWGKLLTETAEKNMITGQGPTYNIGYDSDIVGVFVQGGLLLVVFFLIMLFSIIKHGLIGYLYGGDMGRVAGVIIIGTTIASFMSSLSGRTFFSPKVGLLLFFVLGLCAKMLVLAVEQEMAKKRGARTPGRAPA